MKKITLLFLLLAFSAFSQDCKYKRNETDEFTSKKIVQTKDEVLTISGMGLGFSTNYSLLKVDNVRFLVLTIMSPSVISVHQGSEIMSKTSGSETVSLKFTESEVSKGIYNTTLKNTHHNLKTSLLLTDDAYNYLLENKILKLRVYTSDGYVDDDISEKRAAKFAVALKCI